MTAGLAIYDTVCDFHIRTSTVTSWHCAQMQYVSSPIHTYCVGQACSMGSLLLAAGEKGKRHALPHSSIMIHRKSHVSQSRTRINEGACASCTEPSGGASGQASDIAIHAKEILRVREVLTGIYQKHCGHESESVQEGLTRFRASALLFAQRLPYAHATPFNRDCARAGLFHDR